VVVDRGLVGHMAPGTRVTAVGIYSIYSAREGKSSKVGPLAACHCSDSRVWVCSAVN
jgi:DNA replicative helicase MCM subunit Mcm2 (Cdc46/Mcm family)